MQSHEFQTTLGEIASFRRGVSYKGSELTEFEFDGTPMINMKSFTKEGKYRPEGIKFHNGIFKEKDIIKPDEIVLANTDLTKEGDILGAAVMIPVDLHGRSVVGSHHTTILTVNDERVNPTYLARMINSVKIRIEIKRYRRGATVKGIISNDLKKIVIQIPSLEEQERIVTILDKADEIQHTSETIKEMREQVIRSVFLEIFGDPENPDSKWQKKPFGGLMECKNRIRVPVKKSERETTKGTFPYYGASGIVDYVDSYLFEGEHLLISEDGANLVARVTPIAFIAIGQFWVNNHAHVFAENGNLDAMYCETLFSLLDLSTHITGSAQPKLNKGNLDKIVIPVPPIETQKKFRQIIKNVSKIWNQIDARNSALMNNSNSIAQEMLT